MAGAWSVGTNRFTTREKHQAICHDDGTFTVIGGRSADKVKEGDAWTGTMDASTGVITWVPKYTHPTIMGREAHTVAYSNGQYWSFGGSTDAVAGTDSFWALEGTTWSQVSNTASSGPPGRYRHRAATLSNGSFVVMLGMGQTDLYNDVWMFTPSGTATGAWTLAHNGSGIAPAPRFDPCCVFRASMNSVVCFGGTIMTGDTNEVWEFFADNATWVQRTTAGTSPSHRRLAHCHVIGESLTVWSGFSSGISGNSEGDYFHELPLATTLTWVNHALSNGPVTRDGGAVCGNSTHQYLLGGLGTDGVQRNDIWTLRSTSGTLSWVQVSAQQLFPPARSEHNAVMVGTQMVIGFGQNSHGYLDDVWAFNTVLETWEVLDSTSRYTARSGAAAIARGDQVWFVGGELSTGELTMEVITFDTTSKSWNVIAAKNAPEGRKRHAAASVDGLKVLVVGGTTKGESRISEMWVFVPQEQHWYEVSQTAANVMSARRSLGLVQNPADGSLVILGGKGSEVLMDRYNLTIEHNAAQTEYSAVLTPLASTIGSAGLEARSFIRSEAAVMGSGSHYMVCGGAISGSFPVVEADSCYQYNSQNGSNVRVASMPVPNFFATGVYYGSNFYIFGGNYILNGIKQNDVFLDSLQKFTFSSVCAAETAPTQECMYCSLGTHGNPCTPADAGLYKSFLSHGVLQCKKGQFLNAPGSQNGLFCTPCPDGQYQPNDSATSCLPCADGERCPVGSSAPLESSTLVNASDYDEQPDKFNAAEIPLESIVAIIVIWTLFALLIVLFSCLESRSSNKIAEYYIPNEVLEWVHFSYSRTLQVEVSGTDPQNPATAEQGKSRGLTEAQVYNALKLFGECVGVDRATLDGIVTEELVDKMLDPFEEDGTQYVSPAQYQLLIARMFEEKKFPFRFTGSAYHATDGQPKEINKALMFQFQKLDLYPQGHQIFKVGEPLHTLKTKFGGVLSILGWLSVAAITAMLVVLFVYDNMEETMAVLPEVVVKRTVDATFDASVRIVGSSDEAACVLPGTSTCIEENNVTVPSTLTVGTSSLQCYFSAPACSMVFHCEDCSLSNATSEFSFVFGSSEAYSSETFVELSFDSGVQTEFGWHSDGEPDKSEVGIVVKPETQGTVFKGYPSSEIYISTVPTTFLSPRTVVATTFINTTGYHISASATPLVRGHTTDVANFRLSSSVPVKVVLQTDPSFLVIARFVKKDLISLLSSLLGVVSGIGAAVLGAIQFYDGNAGGWLKINRKLEREKAEALPLLGDNILHWEDEHPFVRVAFHSDDDAKKRTLLSVVSDSLVAGGVRRKSAKSIVLGIGEILKHYKPGQRLEDVKIEVEENQTEKERIHTLLLRKRPSMLEHQADEKTPEEDPKPPHPFQVPAREDEAAPTDLKEGGGGATAEEEDASMQAQDGNAVGVEEDDDYSAPAEQERQDSQPAPASPMMADPAV